MYTIRIYRLLWAGVAVLFLCSNFHPAAAQQGKPVAKISSSSPKTSTALSPAVCSQKNMSCCKGTLSRAAVLASNAKAKTVKRN